MVEFTLKLLMRIYGFVYTLLQWCEPWISRLERARLWDLPSRIAGPLPRFSPTREVTWIHGASLGETKVALVFLSVLQKRHPRALFLLTATTRAGVEYLATHASSETVVGTGFVPLDSPTRVGQILEKFRVSRVWLMETELWPGLLWECRARNIPVGMANARIEEGSFRSFLRVRRLLSPLFSVLEPVLAQNETYARRFERLGVRTEALRIAKNIKSNVTIARPSIDEWYSIRQRLALKEADFVLTAGCVHPHEGAVVRTALQTLRERGLEIKCIVVPRHLKAVPELLEELDTDTIRLTDIDAQTPWNTCIIEKIGILEDMYKICDVAVVGGTFVNVGGHNAWEAARYGVPVFFGPDYHTQIESCTRLIQAGVGFETKDGNNLAECILKVTRIEAKRFIESQQRFIESMKADQAQFEEYLA